MIQDICLYNNLFICFSYFNVLNQSLKYVDMFLDTLCIMMQHIRAFNSDLEVCGSTKLHSVSTKLQSVVFHWILGIHRMRNQSPVCAIIANVTAIRFAFALRYAGILIRLMAQRSRSLNERDFHAEITGLVVQGLWVCHAMLCAFTCVLATHAYSRKVITGITRVLDNYFRLNSVSVFFLNG